MKFSLSCTLALAFQGENHPRVGAEKENPLTRVVEISCLEIHSSRVSFPFCTALGKLHDQKR